jgi:hypothetical protein
MLRVSDVWERALHAPDAAITEDGDVIIIRPGHQLDAFPVSSEPHDS